MSLSLNYPTVRPTLLLDFINTDQIDPRITFSRASSATYFNSNGILTTAATNALRRDYNPSTLAPQGFLVEEQRTNSIRNNTMQGAVAGTPGTAPTNWAVTGTADGVAIQIVGTGTENGITYIDIRYSGTATATSFKIVRFEAVNNIAAASGQTWTAATYMRIAAGSTANFTTFEHQVVGYTAGGAVSEQTNTPPVLTSTMTRFITSRTLNNATTAFVTSWFALTFNNGAVVDLTLRIGLPQLEQGAFATSVIPTTTTALTRSADVASVNTLSPWWNSAAGTFYTEFSVPQIGRSGRLLATDDGTISNTIVPTINSNNTVGISAINGGVYGGDVNSANSFASANVPYKAAFTFSTSTPETVCLNGGTVATGGVTLPTPSQTRMLLGIQANSAATLNGYLRRVSFYPRQLSNAEIQALTA